MAGERLQGKLAVLYEKLGGKKVGCKACSHYCIISEGASGICGVRRNVAGKLRLVVYGRASAANVDPVEKKPLFHFLPGTGIFSIGTIGCNFGCEFCQNWDISQASKQAKLMAENSRAHGALVGKIAEMGQELPPEKIVDYCVHNGIKSIAFTYNEPVIFFEYAFDTMKLARRQGIKSVFVSNGYESREAIKKMHNYLDAINIDLKAFTEEFYSKNCKAKLAPVLENIKRMHEAGIWIEITTLVIPGENDSPQELAQIAGFIASVGKSIPWHITAFHPDYKMKEKESTQAEKLHEAHEIGKKAGLEFVYTGNVFDSTHQSTYCPQCSNLVVQRNWNSSQVIGIVDGKCWNCGTKIPGVWA